MGLDSLQKASISSLLSLALFSTCCMCWPTEYRRSYNYIPPNLMSDLALADAVNPWELAQEPYVDEQADVEYYAEPNEWTDIQALSTLLDMYDEAAQQQQEEPMWGQIVREKPETELEELKQLSYGHRDEKRADAKPAAVKTEAVFTTTTSSPVTSSSRPPVTHLRVDAKAPLGHGQKEIPLLRPPNPVKTLEPAPVLTQRSLSSNRKPSPYDTLRRYLTIEDALKKEAEKRRAPAAANTRQVKRSYVMDEDSLTGQLNSLKKSVN